MDVKVKVLKKFNEELGSSLNNLKEIERLHMKLEYDKTKVEESVCIYFAIAYFCKDCKLSDVIIC